MNTLQAVREEFRRSLEPVTSDPENSLRAVRPTQDPKFGDYQANFAMTLAKELGRKPREIADEVAETLRASPMFSRVEVAGPGFINVRLSDEFLRGRLHALWSDANACVSVLDAPKTMIVDYSSPNVAKPMHVGHLRSTIIGDALARIYRSLGWRVIADNHLGDWGTQFGMLIHGWRHLRDEEASKRDPLAELARLYKKVNALSESDPAVARAARDETAKLHDGDEENLALWREFMPWCLADLDKIYSRLDIHFDHSHGESFYHPMLAETVEELQEQGIARESDGAICVFFPNREGKVDEDGAVIQDLPPTIIRKADGAFTYATSDLACIKHRTETMSPDVIVYVVDDRQSLHFQQIFRIASDWGYNGVELEHVAFGKIMGKDGRPYKTREGSAVVLESLLDEAIERSLAVVRENSPDLDDSEKHAVAEAVGIGAVKYADLSQNRTSDYIFDWDKMISLQGNTATYLQYVYARNRSIFRKGGVDPVSLTGHASKVTLDHPSERALALSVLQFGEALEQAAEDYKPNVLTSYLFSLANAYNGFFRDCSVLKAETEDLKGNRLVLGELTARTIERGLGLLGIRTVERM